MRKGQGLVLDGQTLAHIEVGSPEGLFIGLILVGSHE